MPLFLWFAATAPVIPLITWWAATTSRQARRTGRPLTPEERQTALRLGVRDPSQVRITITPNLPLPGPRWLHRLASKLGFPATESIGLAIGYAIFLHPAFAHDPHVLTHELAHSAQYERLGGLRPFLHRYLAECLTHGYADAPLEREARAAAA
jgi:hypothetical protein